MRLALTVYAAALTALVVANGWYGVSALVFAAGILAFPAWWAWRAR